eukprot:6293257-Karenia_brevis.AAC.1
MLSYVGQMLEVPKDVLRTEGAVLQRILKTSYNSFINSTLFNRCIWGGPHVAEEGDVKSAKSGSEKTKW